MILLALFFICLAWASDNGSSSINRIEMVKKKGLAGQAKIMAQLSKIGHPKAPSGPFEWSNYDFEKLTDRPAEQRPSEQPIFKSAQVDQKIRGLEQLKAMYQVLKNGESIHKNPDANTIRFVPSIKIIDNQKSCFIFNLSMLGQSEKILSAELYMNKRLLKHRPMVNIHYYLSNYSNLDETMPHILNSSVSSVIDMSGFRHRRRRTNWLSFDLVDSVNSFLTTRINRFKFGQINNNLIKKNVYFTIDKDVSKQSKIEDMLLMIDSDQFRNVPARLDPYLIVYSRESETEMKNFFKNRLPIDLLDERGHHQLSHVESDINQPEQTEVYHSKDSSIKLIETKPASINKTNLFNYLPNYKENLNLNNIELIFRDHFRTRRDLNGLEGSEETNWTSLLLPWDHEQWNHDFNETKKEKIKCQTKPLIIDFQDLSFSNWIIEPKRFQGNYCDGSCKYPYNKELSFSNYAALQSILNAIKLSVDNETPELCCTPSSTSKLPIFYKDSNSVDYVVKYLPDMIVTECSCR